MLRVHDSKIPAPERPQDSQFPHCDCPALDTRVAGAISDGDQSHSNAAFWDTDFRLVIKKQKTQKETLTFPHYLPKGNQMEKPA